jgi:hypothetical protein
MSSARKARSSRLLSSYEQQIPAFQLVGAPRPSGVHDDEALAIGELG